MGCQDKLGICLSVCSGQVGFTVRMNPSWCMICSAVPLIEFHPTGLHLHSFCEEDTVDKHIQQILTALYEK